VKAGLFKPFKTVFWSFFGVRKRADNEDDFAGVSPVHVVIAGVIGAAMFVGVLVTLVKIIVG
jgi:Protein of unknown function (DUF2970)